MWGCVRVSIWAVVAATILMSFAPDARADSCETFPGSQVYTDQNCDKPYDGAPKKSAPPAVKKTQQDKALRDALRKRLQEGSSSTETSRTQTADALDRRVIDARARVDAALKDSNAPGAKQRYDKAMSDLRHAYDDGIKAFPDKADDLRNLRDGDLAGATGRAMDAAWNAPAMANNAPAGPSGPANIGSGNGFVYVCDAAIAGGNNVSCREISPDGKECLAVTLADGDMGWRDSTATPCRKDDLAQRKAYLAANPDAAAAAAGTPSAFRLDNPTCQAIVQNYVAAARANDGPNASAGLIALKQAGGCGVLKDTAADNDPRFLSRGDTPMLDQTALACDQHPQECAQIAAQLKAGTSSGAIAAMYSNAIGIGLQVGLAMGQGVLAAQQASMPAPRHVQSNMNSLAPSRIRNGSGQGSPTRAVRSPPPPVSTCKIGGAGWCTAL